MRIAAISSRRRRPRCGASSSITPGASARRSAGRATREPLSDLAAPEPDEELLALNEALDKLAATDSQKAKLVELRYFTGLTGEQAAQVLGISPTTADRHWSYARAWLQAEVRGS